MVVRVRRWTMVDEFRLEKQGIGDFAKVKKLLTLVDLSKSHRRHDPLAELVWRTSIMGFSLVSSHTVANDARGISADQITILDVHPI